MKTFTDNAGRTWTVAINVDAIKRVKGLAGVNLLDVISGNKSEQDLLARLSSDPILLCDVLYALCKPEADPRKVSDEDFGRGMAGDAIDHATTALLEELVNFFPQAKRRVLDKALRKLQMLEARVIDLAEKKLDSPEISQAMEMALASLIDDFPGADDVAGLVLPGDLPGAGALPGETLKNSSGNSPALPESIPGL